MKPKIAKKGDWAVFLLISMTVLLLISAFAVAQSSSGLKGGSSEDFNIVAGAGGTIGDKGNGSIYNVTIHGQNQPMGKGNGSVYNVSLGYLYTIESQPAAAALILFPTNNSYYNRQPLHINVTFARQQGLTYTIRYYINGKLNQTSAVNTTLNASDGQFILNVSIFDGVVHSANTTVNFTIDTLLPDLNTSINLTQPRYNYTINVSANVSDETALDKCQFVDNQSGYKRFQNYSLSSKFAECSQLYNITLPRRNVINLTVIIFDKANNTNQSEYLITVNNTPPPQIELLSPGTNNQTINRTLAFAWRNATDADNDTLIFLINITCQECSADNRIYNVSNTTNYTIAEPLKYLWEDSFFYNWTITASDNVTYGERSAMNNFSIISYISLRMLTDTVAFGTMQLNEENTTHDDVPSPFSIENEGNVIINVSISSNMSIWASESMPTINFQYKIDNYSNENFSYDFNNVNTSNNWTNFTSTAKLSIANMSWQDRNDSAEIDLRVKVPTIEPAGIRAVKIIFNALYHK